MSYRDEERALEEQVDRLERERDRLNAALEQLPKPASSGPRWRVRALGFFLAFGVVAAIGLPFCTILTSAGEGGDRLHLDESMPYVVLREEREGPLRSCELQLRYLNDEDTRCRARLRCDETVHEAEGRCRTQPRRAGVVFEDDDHRLAASTGWSGRAALRTGQGPLQLARRIDTEGQVAEVRVDAGELRLGDGAVLSVDEETRISGDATSLPDLASRFEESDVLHVSSRGIYARRRGELKQIARLLTVRAL